MKPKREFIDTLTQPSQIELAMEHCLDVLSQIPITVVAVGKTAEGVIKHNLTGKKLSFIAHKQSLEPYPDSDYIQKLRNMCLRDEAVHYQIRDLIVMPDKLGFTIDDTPVEIELISKGKFPSVDDPDCVNFRFDYVWIPNSAYPKQTGGVV